jgi:hypothetical protein
MAQTSWPDLDPRVRDSINAQPKHDFRGCGCVPDIPDAMVTLCDWHRGMAEGIEMGSA